MFLEKYNDTYAQQLDLYQLAAEQLLYTMAPKECIALSKQDETRHSVLAFNDDKELVTFFVLHEKEGVKPYSEREDAILLRAFSTDFCQQGKGYAKQALLLLPGYVKTHFPSIQEIVLAVNETNIAAQALYKKCGFVDEGERRMGPKGLLIVMSYVQ